MIKNGKKIKFYNYTFLIIAQKNNKEDYLIEIFADATKRIYYINKIYEDLNILKDILMFPDYAIIIGTNIH